MSFDGSLSAFSISEILQLIATQGKTGVLEIETEEGITRVRFVQGQMLDAFPAKSDPNQAIGAILVRMGLITERQLEYALQTQQRTLRRLGDILIRMGAIRTSDFQSVLMMQRREMAFSLLRLKSGSYSFLPRSVEYEKGVDSLLSVDALLMEGSRQIDEWPDVLKRIPTDTLIYKRVSGAQPFRPLTEDEEKIYALADEPRTVREYIDTVRVGEFRAWDALASLYDMGLVEKVRKIKETKPEPKRAPRVLPPTIVDFTFGILITLAAIGVIAFTGLHANWELGRVQQAALQAQSDLRKLSERNNHWSARRPERWPPPVQMPPR